MRAFGAILVGSLGLQGCLVGGMTAGDGGTADAGSDGACSVPADSGLNAFQAPNAPLNGAGATQATCYACVKSACGTPLSLCGNDCVCNNLVLTAYACASAGGGPLTCADPLVMSNDPALLTLAVCLATTSQCRAACAQPDSGI